MSSFFQSNTLLSNKPSLFDKHCLFLAIFNFNFLDVYLCLMLRISVDRQDDRRISRKHKEYHATRRSHPKFDFLSSILPGLRTHEKRWVRIIEFLHFVHPPVFYELESTSLFRLHVSQCFLVSRIQEDGQSPKTQ